MKIAIVGLEKGSVKRLWVREKSGNLDMDIEWQPCLRMAVILFFVKVKV